MVLPHLPEMFGVVEPLKIPVSRNLAPVPDRVGDHQPAETAPEESGAQLAAEPPPIEFGRVFFDTWGCVGRSGFS